MDSLVRRYNLGNRHTDSAFQAMGSSRMEATIAKSLCIILRGNIDLNGKNVIPSLLINL
jgi:hypothetical protein